jgi:hypothetical protein
VKPTLSPVRGAVVDAVRETIGARSSRWTCFVCAEVCVRPWASVTRRVTTYSPGAAYVCVGSKAVEVVPSPKSQNDAATGPFPAAYERFSNSTAAPARGQSWWFHGWWSVPLWKYDVGAPAAGATGTTPATVVCPPSASVTVSFTNRSPAAAKAWLGDVAVEVVPSPKSHR